ncbi:inaD-like protein isoform X2 [Stigmatopora nigra]
MLYHAGERFPVAAVSPDERRRAAAALERLGAKLAEREEWRRHGLRVAALKEILDSPLFAQVLALQRAVAQPGKQQLSPTPPKGDRDRATEEPTPAGAGTDAPALGAPPSPRLLDRWIRAAAGGRQTEHVRLTRPPSGGLGFSVVGLHPGSGGGHGVFVKHVQPGGAAHRDGGLRARDQILTVNGHPLEAGVSQAQALALLQEPGGTVQMTVARERREPPPPFPGSPPSPPPPDVDTVSGVDATRPPGGLIPRSPQGEWAEVEEIRLTNDGSGLGFGVVGAKNAGVVVRTLLRGGAADRDGRLRTGDRLLRIGATPAEGLGSDEAAEALRACGTHVVLLVARDPRGVRAPPPPPDSAPVIAPPPRAGKTPNLDGYEIHQVALAKQDGQSLGISIIGHNPLSAQDAVGAYIKNVVAGSAAHQSGNIRVHDRLIALDGVSLHGLTNGEVVDVMKSTGRNVLLTLVRKKNSSFAESSAGSPRRSADLKTGSADLDAHNDVNRDPGSDLKAEWQEVVGPNYQVLVMELHPTAQDDDAQLQRSSKLLPVHTLRLGVELDSFDGHHYVSSVAPGGPADRHGVLAPEDELLQVNQARLHGMSRREVLSFLKEAPPPFTVVCCRRTASARLDGEWERRGSALDDLEAKLTSALGAPTGQVEKEEPQIEREEEEEEDGELAMWSRSVDVLELSKEADGGLGFSILDYQDPLDPSGCVMVIRSLVAGGPAERSGALLPGDQLVWVNGVSLARMSLRRAVDVLKGAPPGAVRLGVRKPLVGSPSDFNQGRWRENQEEELEEEQEGWKEEEEPLTDAPYSDLGEGAEMAVDEEEEEHEEEEEARRKAPPSPERPNSFQSGRGEDEDEDADPEVGATDLRAIDTEEKRRRGSHGGFAATRRGRRDLPEREEGEGEETPDFSHWGPPRRVEVRPERGESLGLSIVGGGRVIKRLRNGEELKGILVKKVVRGSPAARVLRTGDKILQVSGVDLREATHQEAVDAIKSAQSPVLFIVQSLAANPGMARLGPPPLRDPPPYRPPGQSEAPQGGRGDTAPSVEAGRGDPAHAPDRAPGATGPRGPDGRPRVSERSTEVNGQRNATSSAVRSAASEAQLLPPGPALSRDDHGRAAPIPPPPRERPPPPAHRDAASRSRRSVSPPPPEEEGPVPVEWPRPPDGDMLRLPSGEDSEPESPRGAAARLPDDREEEDDQAPPSVTLPGPTTGAPREGDGSRGPSDDEDVVKTGSPASREQDPLLPGRETTLEIRKGPSGLGLSVVGGRDTRLRAVVILQVYRDGAAAKDGRLRPGDQLLEINGVDLRRASHQEAISALRRPSSKAVITVRRGQGRGQGRGPGRRHRRRRRSDTPASSQALDAVDDGGRSWSVDTPPASATSQEEEEEEGEREGGGGGTDEDDGGPEDAGGRRLRTVCISRGAGDSLGVSIAGGRGSPLGDVPVFIAMIQDRGAAAKTQGLKVGDRIVSIDGRSVDAKSHQEVVDMLKESTGNVCLQVIGDTDMAAILSQVENLASQSTFVNAQSHRAQTLGLHRRTIVVEKSGEGFGFTVVGGVGSAHGDLPIYVKSVFNKGAAAAATEGFPKRGDQVLSVNGQSLEGVTHEQAVAILKKHTGSVTLQLLS